MSSNQCGRYMLFSHGTIRKATSSSTGVDDAYGIADIPSPLEVSTISDVDALCCITSYLAANLLGSYQALLTVIGIPLSDIGGNISHILSRIVGS